MQIIILLPLFMVTIFSANAQMGKGNIINQKQQPLAGATIFLLKAKDSSLLQTTITNNEGNFMFNNVDTMSVLVRVNIVGYTTQTQRLMQQKTLQIAMLPSNTTLIEVVVTAKKQIIEVKPDKIIFNVENSINAIGNSGFDLLRKSPGVVIDNNDNISLLGSAATIYIDSKPSPLSGKDLAANLKTLQSTNIESIEIIKNPSAKYDAAGAGGIINIRLKKNKNYGLNGNINAGYGIGVYGKYNTGLSLNYRNKKVNIFSNYSNNFGKNQSYINLYREQADSIYNQKSMITANTNGQNIKTGIDIFINNKNTFGFLATVIGDDWHEKNNTATPITSINTKMAGNTLVANNVAVGSKLNYNFNANYRYADTSGREWNTDIDFGVFTNNNNNYQPNQYKTFDLQSIVEEKNYNINTDRKINLLTIKTDYEQKLGAGKLGFGLKSSFVKTNNIFDFYNRIDQQNIIDSNRSNTFKLTENIYAAYVNYQIKIKKWDAQVGVRAEETNTIGTLGANNNMNYQQVKRRYLNFFPSFGVSYQTNNNNSFGINFSRRISRPTYQNLNPFESKLDELSYQKGNPFLKPEYTNSIALTHTYKYTLNTSIGYKSTTNFSTQITDTIEGKRNFIQQRNAGTQQTIYANISYPYSIKKWWSTYSNIGGTRQYNNVDVGLNKKSNLVVNTFNIYSQQTFTLPQKYAFEFSGFYNSPGIWGGTFLSKAFWGIDAGIQKRFLQESLSVKLAVSDIFKTMHWRGISNFNGLYMDASGGWESRQLKINSTYKFGKNTIKAQRKRSTGSDDINKRF